MTCLPSAAFLEIYARSENRTRTGFPTRPSNVRVYQFRHPSLKRTYHYFAGEAAGEVAGEAVVPEPLAGLAAAVGEAAGVAVGAVAGLEAGDGWVAGDALSSTTDCVPIPGSEKTSAMNIKIIAAITVAFSSGF
jgi:hypothetical protein